MSARRINLEDIQLGDTATIEVCVSIHDIDRFAELTGDHAPVHVDSDFASARGFTGRVAHGVLLAGYISRFIGMRLPGVMGVMQSLELQFVRPVEPPALLTITGEVTRISAAVGQVTIQVEVLCQGICVVKAKAKSILPS